MPTKTQYNTEAMRIIHEMMENLKNLESEELKLLSSKWQVVSARLEFLITKLSEKEFLSKDQLFKDVLYKDFLQQSKFLIAKYDKFASGIILENQVKASELGVNTTYKILDRFGVNFYKLSPEKINVMIGITKDSAPLYDILIKSYPKTIDKLVSTLISSQALGYNPYKTAGLMVKDMGGNKTRSLLIARTEQLRSNREASLMSMRESGICKGWIRVESMDDKTCDECAEANGKKYKFDEIFDSHPNCRGACAPDID